MPNPTVLAFAGSMRTGSWNKKLIKLGAQAARDAGAEVTLVDLRDYPLPIYDGDLEAASGIPEKGKMLKRLFLNHSGLMISSPEYNSSIPGGLKNALDWVSRSEPGEPPLSAFSGKVAALMSASPGMFGGSRGLAVLRMMLGNIRVLVLPDQVSVSKANEAFTPEGTLHDEKQAAAVQKLGKTLAQTIAKLNA
jgi:chromate reductase